MESRLSSLMNKRFGEGVYLTLYPSSRPNTDTVYSILASSSADADSDVLLSGFSIIPSGQNYSNPPHITQLSTCKLHLLM